MVKPSAQRPEFVQMLLVAFSSDVLLACGQGQNPSSLAVRITGFTGNFVRHLAGEFFPRREQPHIWPTEIHGIPNGLAFGSDHISPHFTR